MSNGKVQAAGGSAAGLGRQKPADDASHATTVVEAQTTTLIDGQQTAVLPRGAAGLDPDEGADTVARATGAGISADITWAADATMALDATLAEKAGKLQARPPAAPGRTGSERLRTPDLTSEAQGEATTQVRAEQAPAVATGKLHPQLQTQLSDLNLRSDGLPPDLAALLRVVSAHYNSIEEERRGIVQSMRLMADEARALANEAHEQSSEHLQVILDHIKDVVITVNEEGVIQTFNPTGEQVFGHAEAEVVGQRIDLLIPQIAVHGSVRQALQRLAASTGDPQQDLAGRDSWGQKKNGEFFPAEVAVSKARVARREVFVLCLRDITERRESEQAMRESEARYRLLVNHAPEAIVVHDVDAGRFVDANENAERYFALDRTRLLQVDPLELSPAVQPDGAPSGERAREYLQRALDGEQLAHEWLYRDSFGREISSEVRLVRLPSGGRRLVRASIADISERKRTERVAAAEREVFRQLASSATLHDVLASITKLIESVSVGTACSLSILAPDGQSFTRVVAPRLPERLRRTLQSAKVDIRNGSCAAAVYLGRQVLVADVASDPFWEQYREAALDAGLRAAWSTPLKSSKGRLVGSLGVFRSGVGLPSGRESEVITHAAQLAGIAIERRLADEALRKSESRFRGLFESIAEGVYQSGRDGRLLSVNPAFVSILGYNSAEELYSLSSVAQLYANPADRADILRQADQHGEIRQAEVRMRRRDGQQVVILENARAVRDTSGQISGYEGTIADITERKRAEQAVFAEKERAQVTLQSIGDAVISTDAEGQIDYINPVAESLTGWSLDEARGRPIADVLNLVNEISREPIENPLMRALGRGSRQAPADHSVLVTRLGAEVAIQESAAPICDRQGRVIGAVIVFHDVTKERRLKRALSYQASHDALTGLINRREFDNRLHAAVQSAQRGEGTYALLYVDLDQFKVVNDTCGHQAGDHLLRDITALLQQRVRASDTIARLGGDEFGVLLERCTLDQATKIADGVRQAIREYRFVWGSSTLSVGASVGVVQIKADTENVASVMSAADLACYTAKDEGRNRVHVFEQDAEGDTATHRQREMQWVARVTRAVEENRLELFFQPIVPVSAEATIKPFLELTVRLRDDDGELVPANEFIPAAERYNVMPIIDRWVVTRAVELLKDRHRRGASLPLLAVNLSGTSLNEQTFADFIMHHVSDLQIASALCFEITETAAVGNLAQAIYIMREMKSRGCKFALDDFGSGLSSFMYLKTLPVDYLKIDGEFIGNVATDKVDASMVEAIGKVGRALGIATVAECVETQAVLEALRRIGVDFAQGFFVASPRPVTELDSAP